MLSAPTIGHVLAKELPVSLVRPYADAFVPFFYGRSGEPDHGRHVIISTKAGTGRAFTAFKHYIEPFFRAYSYIQEIEVPQYDTHFTISESSVIELVEQVILPEATKGHRQSIILLSGDGGVIDIIDELMALPHTEQYRKPEISLFPLGTGNALANSTGINRDNTLGLRSFVCGRPKQVPVFCVRTDYDADLLVNEGNEERKLRKDATGMGIVYGAVVCSWGLHATLVADSDTTEYRKFGAERFKMAGKEALFPSDGSQPHAYEGILSTRATDDSEWQVAEPKEHGYVLATLVSHLESTFNISPASQPLDGQLRLVRFGPLDGKAAMEIMSKAYDGGKHVHDDRVSYEEIRGLKIFISEGDSLKWRRVCVDGKIIRAVVGREIEVTMVEEGIVDLVVR